MTHTFTLPLAPVAKGRPRFGKGRVYTPWETRRFEREVARLARKHAPPEPHTGAIVLDLVFAVRAPKRRKLMRPTTRPDLDNFEKALCDALNGIFWVDDAQIVNCNKAKVYADGAPSISVRIVVLENRLIRAKRVTKAKGNALEEESQ